MTREEKVITVILKDQFDRIGKDIPMDVKNLPTKYSPRCQKTTRTR